MKELLIRLGAGKQGLEHGVTWAPPGCAKHLLRVKSQHVGGTETPESTPITPIAPL